MFGYKSVGYFIFIVLLTIENHELKFNELVRLQLLDQKRFDSSVINYGFVFSSIKHNEFARTAKSIYFLSDSINNMASRIERKVDSVFFGKKNKLFLIVTVDFIVYDERYYEDLLTSCKKEGYYLRSVYASTQECPNIKIEEYQKEARVACFSTGILKGNNRKFYKISVSISPK